MKMLEKWRFPLSLVNTFQVNTFLVYTLLLFLNNDVGEMEMSFGSGE